MSTTSKKAVDLPMTAKTRQSSRANLLERARAARDSITPEEDAAITAAALTDPDALPDRPRRGRPAAPDGQKKEPVMLRLDPDVLAHFRAGGDGWQTRINAALRKTAGLEPSAGGQSTR